MAHPTGGDYQHLLLKGADNGRLRVQQQRAGTRAAPVSQNPNWRNGERGSFGRGTGPVARQVRSSLGVISPGSFQHPRPPPTHPAAVIPPGWSTRKSATLVLRPIPTDAKPWDIRQFFERFGRVVWVELGHADRGAFRSAKVRFEPPPTDSSFFQQGRCRLSIAGSVSWPFVEFPRHHPEEPTLTTPLGNTCPARLALKPEKLTFGLLTHPTTFMIKKEVLPLTDELDLNLAVDFKRKRIIIHFPFLLHRERQYYRMDIKFSIVKRIHRITVGEGRSALVISVEDPPLFRKKQETVDGAAWTDRLVWGEDELWNRVVEVRADSQNPKSEPVSLGEKPSIVDLGRWTTYWVDLAKFGDAQWSDIEAHLRDWNIATKLDATFTQVPSKSSELWNMLAETHSALGAGADFSWNKDLALLSSTAHISLPYDVRYQLEVCLSHDILCEYNITREFLEKLVELSQPGGLNSSRARLILEYAADQGKPIYDPMDLLSDRAAMAYYPTTLHIPDYCALVRKVTITPTRIYFNTPTVETTNRIVRRYKRAQDHFIRVQFTDELLDGRIRACEVDRDDELYTRVYRVMMQGVRMGQWHWKFLAFGNSQIRESGAFFFCEPDDKSITCNSIRQWMGNFSHISSVAKLAARLGQCFSTTRLLHCISAPIIVKIPDVEKNGFCFTDGVGKISSSLARLVASDWKIEPAPSAFQFRMGGCKGVLVTWPDAKGTEVHVRPSQEKFSAEYNGLEIIRCSQFSCATLNRQTISILSCLGVPDEVFIDMMALQIANYDIAMTDKDKAVELLTSYVDENMTTTTIATMVLNGFMHTREPFVRTLLQLWRSWSIKALKEKARLIVDQGAFVLGCVDETRTLRGHSRLTEGRNNIPRDRIPQIFLQVPDSKNRGFYKVITGLCLVGRNPSLHPGDVRVVEAVDVAQLRHLRDVVVFPMNGDQDIPSMCSGGDLDGDDFFVIWDPKLLPSEWSHPPMNYSAPKPLTEPRASTAKSLSSFFVLFMKNDRLPLIAHAHLATADYEDQGAKHEKCLKLAELHSTAVDYVKTGVPAVWDKKLDPRRYPHFMEKAKSKTYHSTRVLGKLYDMVDKEAFDNKENYKLPFDDRILKRYQLDNALLKEARKIKSQYDIAMRRIMGQLDIKTEFEVWTTFVLSRPKVGTDYKVQEKVGREGAGLKKQFRDLCNKVAEEQNFDRLEFVAAMYKVTWEETRIALHEARQQHVLPDGTVGLRRVSARSMPLISFPWIFPTELGRIALGAEKLPSFSELWASSATASSATATKSKARGANRSDTDLDFEEMDYTKTSDGQFIHRGEILKLFRHDDDDEEGFYCGDELGTPDSPAGSVSNGLPKKEQGVQVTSPESTDGEGSGGFVDLLDLDSVLDEISCGSGATALVRNAVGNVQATASPQTTRNIDMLDLLSSDMDAGSNSSPCLTPDKVSAEKQEQLATEAVQPVDANTKAYVAAQSTIVDSEAPAAIHPTNIVTEASGASREEVRSAPTTAADSVVSDSIHSWDRVTSADLDSSLELDPVEYIALPSIGAGLADARLGASGLWGRVTRPSLEEVDIWASPAGVAAGGPSDEPRADGNGADDGSDGGVEYEEEIIEVVGETALERAARFC